MNNKKFMFLAFFIFVLFPSQIYATNNFQETLSIFLDKDCTDEGYYKYGEHDCMDFSTELIQNLTIEGYKAGSVAVYPRPCAPDSGHMLVWVQHNDTTVYVEPQNDIMYTPKDYFNMTNNTEYKIVEISYTTARIELFIYRCTAFFRKILFSCFLLY